MDKGKTVVFHKVEYARNSDVFSDELGMEMLVRISDKGASMFTISFMIVEHKSYTLFM